MPGAQAQAALARGALGDPGRAYLACIMRGGLSPIGPAAWRDTTGARTGDAGLDWAALQRGAAAGAGRAAAEGACLGEAAHAAATSARACAAPAASRAAEVRQLAATTLPCRLTLEACLCGMQGQLLACMYTHLQTSAWCIPICPIPVA
jgi:hypothetical protein